MKIELSAVEKWYNRGLPNEVHALQQIELAVAENEVVCIQGPSGSGKSTLLCIIGALFGPTSGRAAIDGRSLARLPDRFLTRYRRELVGFIFQRFQIIEELTVADNVALPLLPLGVSLRERRQRTAEALERLNISHRSSFPAGGISGGELQRAVIARALINDPAIILADEPTAHLDSRLSLQFMDIIEELKAAGKAIVIASHDPLVFDHPVIDRCLFMRDGRLTAHRPD